MNVSNYSEISCFQMGAIIMCRCMDLVYKRKSQLFLDWKGIYYTTRISLYTIVWLAGWQYPSNGIRAFLFLRTNAWPYFSIFSTTFVPCPLVILTSK